MGFENRVLVVAGSDSSGGAGLEADQRVLAVHNCYALTATTALTAQNTLGVQDIHEVPAQFVRKQINAGLEDIGAAVVKIGMLASAETVGVLSAALRQHKVSSIILDPVMVSTSGSQLLPPEAVKAVRTELLPQTTVLTPNISEATLLLRDAGREIRDPESLEDAIQLTKELHALGPKYILLKGGHLPLTTERRKSEDPKDYSIVVDVLYDGHSVTVVETDFLLSKNTHGTGCSLASAIAGNVANGMSIEDAVRSACRFVEAGIKTSVDLGEGHGPINHFHSHYSLPFAPGRFLEYLLGRPDVQPVWKAFTEHEFVMGLAKGTLSLEKFKGYLIQDYLYLVSGEYRTAYPNRCPIDSLEKVQFARSNALLAYKRKTMESISASAKIVLHIEREMALHLDYCASFGLSKEEIEASKESQACTAYSRYLLDVGQSEDWLALHVALAPCLIGYGAIAKRLHGDESSVRTGNMYWKWVENYVAEDYSEAVRTGSDILERNMRDVSPKRLEELVSIFVRATELEIGFWNMGIDG